MVLCHTDRDHGRGREKRYTSRCSKTLQWACHRSMNRLQLQVSAHLSVRAKHKQFLSDKRDGYGESEWPAKDGTKSEIHDCRKRPLTILVAGRYERVR